MSKYMGQIMAECDCQHQACEMRGYCMAARIEQLAATNKELEAKLAKAMLVVEMIASEDVDAVLGQAVDLSCEIIGELMEDEDDE